jgi:hypothetical protein
VIFIFFNTLAVIVVPFVVDTERGIYVPLNVTTLPDPIVVFVIFNVPELTTINVNPIVVPVGVNDEFVIVKLVLPDVIRALIPFPIVVPNRILIKINVNDPLFVIPDPLLPNVSPKFIFTNDVELDFTVVPVNVTCVVSSPLVPIFISPPFVTIKCIIPF